MPIEANNLPGPPRDASPVVSVTRASFLILILSLGWMQPFFRISGQSLTPTDIIFPFVFVLWIISIGAGKLRFRWHRSFWILAFYFATLVVSSIFSADQRSSFIKLAGEAYLIGLPVIGFSLLDDERRMKHAAMAWLAGSAVAVAVGLFAIGLFYAQPNSSLLPFLTYHYGAVPVGNYPRLSSVSVSASMFCNYLNVTVVLLLVAGKREWIGRKVYWCGLAAVAVCSAFTISIGLGGIFLAVGFWIWYFSENIPSSVRRLALAGGLSAALAFLVLGFVALEPYQNAPYVIRIPVIEKIVYPSPRLLVWSETIRTFEDDWLTGKGLNSPTSSVVFQNTEGSRSLLTDAHNTFLSVGAQNGIFSLAAMLALCVYLLRVGSAGWKRSSVTAGLTIAFVTAFLYQGLTGAFEDARHLWVLIGLLLAASKFGSGAEESLTHGAGV